MTEKKIVIIAGPNGAGKTTFAREFLPYEAHCPVFVNADLIAAGLAPFAPASVNIRAGRLMLEELDRHARSGVSFAFETTLSGSVYVKRIADWRALGYVVKLIFLRLDTAEEAIARVEARVLQGGHDIPENTVRRRYIKGYENFLNIYQPSVNFWQLFDNSGLEPRLINEGANP